MTSQAWLRELGTLPAAASRRAAAVLSAHRRRGRVACSMQDAPVGAALALAEHRGAGLAQLRMRAGGPGCAAARAWVARRALLRTLRVVGARRGLFCGFRGGGSWKRGHARGGNVSGCAPDARASKAEFAGAELSLASALRPGLGNRVGRDHMHLDWSRTRRRRLERRRCASGRRKATPQASAPPPPYCSLTRLGRVLRRRIVVI